MVVSVGNLDHAPAGLLKDVLEGGDDLLERNAGIHKQRREDLQLILFFETSNRGHFRNSGNRLQRGLDLALVHQTQFADIV